MDVREKLDLVDRKKIYEVACKNCTRHGEEYGECYHDEPCEKLIFAFTTAEPVDSVETVQECGHWMPYQSDEPYGCKDEKEWYKCSKCGKDAYGRCYEDEWYSAPILSNHCPHCGVKMMPQPPKGE